MLTICMSVLVVEVLCTYMEACINHAVSIAGVLIHFLIIFQMNQSVAAERNHLFVLIAMVQSVLVLFGLGNRLRTQIGKMQNKPQ